MISNGGFADIYIVFKIDDDKNLTAFIVEKSREGITMNPEEDKLESKDLQLVKYSLMM